MKWIVSSVASLAVAGLVVSGALAQAPASSGIPDDVAKAVADAGPRRRPQGSTRAGMARSWSRSPA